MASVAERLRGAAAAARNQAKDDGPHEARHGRVQAREVQVAVPKPNGTPSSAANQRRPKIGSSSQKYSAKMMDVASAERDKASADSTATSDARSPALQAAVSALKSPASSTNEKRAKGGTNKFKTAALALKITGATTPWGDYSHLTSDDIDISTLSNEKLKRHLRARSEVPEGTKTELIERLKNSLEEERQKKIAMELELEAKHRRIADLEEQGAIYVTGKNNSGQLGLNDQEDRSEFTVIPSSRGKNFRHVSTAGDTVLATTAQHQVYAWGGSGLGPCGLNSNQKALYKVPQLIEKLNGEEVVMTSIGANHACAASHGGDLFVWGFGVLGMGGDSDVQIPRPQYLDAITVTSIESGEMHTCAKTKENEVFTWGHGANGRLGCGDRGETYQSTPFPVKLPSWDAVKLIACGSEHTLLCTRSAVYSFGCGDCGRLGHGPVFSDRYEPCEITALKGLHVLSISAGTWHSACVVHVPPLDQSGWLYTWGSGFQGQLGLDKECKVSTPTLVPYFVNEGLSVQQIICGRNHNAALSHDGNLYTWGSNKHGALGRSIEETRVPFTPRPGIVAGFGTLVERIGRGLPMSVVCGREYTIVATHPYTGPSEEEALKLAEETRRRDEEERRIREARARAEEDERRRLEDIEAERTKIRYLTSRRLCTMDASCPGFTYEANQPSICAGCGFSVVYHTIVVDEPDETKANHE